MEKYFDINENGLSIRCKIYYEKDLRGLKNIVIATYGFGGNKDNNAVKTFAERIITKYKGFGVICFDWPCHGKDALDRFMMDTCVRYLDLVIHFAREKGAEVLYNYSASMGAYITLRYIHEKNADPFRKTAFRCPAVRIYDALWKHVTPDDEIQLKKGKDVMQGYARKVKLSNAFFDDLKSHDVSSYDYIDYADDIIMIHGTKDEEVPLSAVEKFSEDNVIELFKVENADHMFSNPEYMNFAIQKVIEFFRPEPAS